MFQGILSKLVGGVTRRQHQAAMANLRKDFKVGNDTSPAATQGGSVLMAATGGSFSNINDANSAQECGPCYDITRPLLV